MRISIQIDDQDLKYFQDIMTQAKEGVKEGDRDRILQKAGELLVQAKQTKTPHFVKQKLESLELLLMMLKDTEWDLESHERMNVLSALAYFIEPADLIHDEIPVLGFLDDAIMIELVVRELKHEIEAYKDFSTYKEGLGDLERAGGATRHQWLANKRSQLRNRMNRRISRRYERSARYKIGRSKIRLF